MQRIIQINIGGSLIPIEEDAYLALRDYIRSLERHFSAEPGKDEIIQDIEYRVAELFTVRLQSGNPCIDTADVRKVIETLGPAYTLGSENAVPENPYLPGPYIGDKKTQRSQRRLFRDPNDKVFGGVCSGIAHYFDVDPVIVRLLAVISFLGALIGLFAYIIAWIVIPYPRTPEEQAYMKGGEPMNIYTISKNVHEELLDLKRRGEAMSRDLRDFFSKKK